MKAPISDRAWRWFEQRSFLLPTTMIAFGLLDYAEALRQPTLTKAANGPGATKGIIVGLADPGILDRFMAALPSLSILLTIVFAYGYVAWSYRRDAKGQVERGELRGSLALIMATGFLALVAPMVATSLKASYFDVGLVDAQPRYMLLFMAPMLIVLESLRSKQRLAEQQSRADTLDKKMQDVV